jgi:hypothetical protein
VPTNRIGAVGFHGIGCSAAEQSYIYCCTAPWEPLLRSPTFDERHRLPQPD